MRGCDTVQIVSFHEWVNFNSVNWVKFTSALITENYKKLKNVDLSIIDNGNFQMELIQLSSEIKKDARVAKIQEGDKRKDEEKTIHAFELWQPVYDKCRLLEENYFTNPHIEWAKKVSFVRRNWLQVVGVLIALGILVISILNYLKN